ncbi:MAG TPA: ATP-binding cassette domain-containing protein [Chitinophagaceae bacterium]|nr:ATP-binding cassette domain-containing protein [Chitinophagaceae bacterium]
MGGRAVLCNVSFDVNEGECLAITGESGSGKTTLLRAIAGKYFTSGEIWFDGKANKKPSVNLIEQQHYFRNLSNTSAFYYQQRFNSFDSEDALTVNDVLKSICHNDSQIAETLELLHITYLKNTRLIQLSNGEHKRFQIAEAILQGAEWLLLDNPYTGLDIAARKLLSDILSKLMDKGIHIMLVTSPSEIPSFVSHIISLHRDHSFEKRSRKEFVEKNLLSKNISHFTIDSDSLDGIRPAYVYEEFSTAIRMVDTHVVYNNRKILDNVNWCVNKGECWNVSGHNGSGKSTLLSLVTGDNPQAFANEIYLFDRRKGSGESIWDIKQKIGYLSPELHHYFDSGESCINIVASGLFDTIGLFRHLDIRQRSIVKEWMALLHMDQFENRLFNQLSNGEQRMILLARALVKNPPLLILDEPCQGLDAEVSAAFIRLIDEICVKMKKTLVYVSHYEEEIPPCVTYRLKLTEGRIAA